MTEYHIVDDDIVEVNYIAADVARQEAEALADLSKTNPNADLKVASVIPKALYFKWLHQAGVSASDPAAAEVVCRNAQLDEYSKLRAWKGSFSVDGE